MQPSLEPGEVIAVGHSTDLSGLKQLLLLVDRIAVIHDPANDWDCRAKSPAFAADLDWLEERGLVFRVNETAKMNTGIERLEWKDDRIVIVPSLEPGMIGFQLGQRNSRDAIVSPKLPFTSRDLIQVVLDVACRLECAALRNSWNIDAVAVTAPNRHLKAQPDRSIQRGFVERLLIRKLPTPDDATSLDRIIEFREDLQSKTSLAGLRRWMSGVGKSDLSPVELAQELEWLLRQYEEHMRLHEVKIRKGSIQTFITLAGEVAENLLKIKWGKVAQSLFLISQRRIALLEAEMGAPGRSLSYVVRARRTFGQPE